MATNIDQSGIFGNIVPNVFIKKITLESGGDFLKESNPHIDHERETNIVRNAETGKLEWSKETPNLNAKPKTGGQLRVKVDFIVKEVFDDNLVSTWFSNQDFLKYLHVQIVQSLSEDTTNKIATKQIQLTKLYKWRFSKSIVQRKVVSLETMMEKQSGTNNIFSYVDSDGNKVHELFFSVDFTVPNAEPEHLAIFATSYIDSDSLIRDFELDVPENKVDDFEGRTASELVLDNYEIVSKSFVFTDEQGSVWTGSVHFRDNAWWSGEKENSQSKRLVLNTVQNSKIQDFRNNVEVEKQLLNFSFVQNEVFSTAQKMKVLNNDNLSPERQENYFTDIYLSRDSEGNARFLFGIDYLKYIKDKTIYGNLYKNDEELLKNVRIRSLILKRVRVSNVPGKIKNKNGIAPFEENEVYEPIVFSGESESGKLIYKNTDRGAFKEVVLYVPGAKGVRFFTGLDREMKNVTFGMYQYGIELNIEDRTTNFLEQKLDEILQVLNILNEYYQEGNLRGNYDSRTNQFSQEFIDKQREKYLNDERVSPWVLSVSKYIEILGFLFENVKEDMLVNRLTLLVHPTTGNSNGVQKFLDLVNLLAQSLSDLLGVSVTSKTAKLNYSQSKPLYSSAIKSKGVVPLKVLNDEKYFANQFDSDIPKGVGYDFFSSNLKEKEKNDDGLKIVTDVEFKKRVDDETKKYFKDENVNINLKTEKRIYTENDFIDKTKYAYLTPSLVKLGKISNYELLNNANNFDPTEMKKMLSEITRFNSMKNSPQIGFFRTTMNRFSTLNASEQATKSNLSNLFEVNSSVSIQPLNTVEKEIEKNVRSATSYVGTGSIVNSQDSIEVEIDKNSMQNDVTKNININPILSLMMDKKYFPEKIATSISKYDLNKTENFLDKKNIQKEEIANLPNQIKSIFLSGISPEKVVKKWIEGADVLKDPNESTIFYFNNNIIGRIMVLSSFAISSDGKILVKEPVWKDLTIEVYNQSITKELLCKLDFFENKKVEIKTPKMLKLPIYNQYFILSAKEKIEEKNVFENIEPRIQKVTDKVVQLDKEKMQIKPELMSSLSPLVKTAITVSKIDPNLASGLKKAAQPEPIATSIAQPIKTATIISKINPKLISNLRKKF